MLFIMRGVKSFAVSYVVSALISVYIHLYQVPHVLHSFTLTR